MELKGIKFKNLFNSILVFLTITIELAKVIRRIVTWWILTLSYPDSLYSFLLSSKWAVFIFFHWKFGQWFQTRKLVTRIYKVGDKELMLRTSNPKKPNGFLPGEPHWPGVWRVRGTIFLMEPITLYVFDDRYRKRKQQTYRCTSKLTNVQTVGNFMVGLFYLI